MNNEFENYVSETLGEIKGTLDSLAGENGRVTKLEERIEWSETKQWIQAAVILPLSVGLSSLIRHLSGK